jgi:hypothetical protein
MSKRRKKKGAERLEAQARAHAILYGPEWHEVSDYRQQAMKLIEKHGIRPDEERIGSEELKIVGKRLEEFREGKRKLWGELPVDKVLELLSQGRTVDPGDDIGSKTLRMLEKLGYVKDGELTGKGRDLKKRMKGR